MKPYLSCCRFSICAILLSLNFSAPVIAEAASRVTGNFHAAATIGESEIVALEQATTHQDQGIAVANIRDELGNKRLTETQLERIARVLALTLSGQDNPGQAQQTLGLIKLLQSQPDTAAMSPRTLTLLAESLASDTNLNMSVATEIGSTIAQQLRLQTLPSEAFTTLLAALDHFATSNRIAAITALSNLPKDDHRRSDVAAELAYVLGRNEHLYTRLSVVKALTRMSAEFPLELKVIGAVAKVASGDPYMTVRMEALEALERMSIGSPPRRVPSRANRTLIRELLQPTPELWQRSQGTREHKDLRARAIAYLRDWYKPEYPPDVIQIFINECKGFAPQQSLDILLEIRLRDGLRDSQLFELRNIAANHRQPELREAIYRLALPNLAQGSVVDAEQAFVHSGNSDARLEAGYALLRHYANQPVSEQVAGLASEVLLEAKDNRLREVAAKLIAHSELPRAVKEHTLLNALRQDNNDRELPDILFSLYDPQDLDAFAQRHLEDASLPSGFQQAIIRRLGDSTDREMAPELISVLRRTAQGASSEYYLIATINSAMRARGAPIPLIVTLKGKSFQSGVLSIVWLICLLTTIVIGISAFIGALRLRFSGSSVGAKRASLVIAWLVGTIAMVGLLAIGFVGFLGHNTAPAPSSTVRFNLPLYAALLVYLPLGVLITLRAWRQRHA